MYTYKFLKSLIIFIIIAFIITNDAIYEFTKFSATGQFCFEFHQEVV